MQILITIIIIMAILFLLYLYMIAPRMWNRADLTPFLGRFYAHRGLYDNESDAPENSMKAFRKAVEAGYGIELDIQLTKDDVIVVAHDFHLKRIYGVDKKIIDLTYEELQQYKIYGSEETIPRFSDFLAMVDGRVPLIVEYKSEDTKTKLFELADAMLRDYKGLYCVESFNPLLVLWYRRHHKDVMRGILSDDYIAEKITTVPKAACFVLTNMLLNFLGRPDFVAYHHIYYKNKSRSLCRNLFKAPAVAWTIQCQEDLISRSCDFDLFIFDRFIPEEVE